MSESFARFSKFLNSFLEDKLSLLLYGQIAFSISQDIHHFLKQKSKVQGVVNHL